MAINLYKLEEDLKEVYNKDPYAPEVYIAIRDLAEGLIVVKNLLTYREEIFEVAHMTASEIYMDILKGRVDLSSPNKYISRRILGIRDWYNFMYRPRTILVKDEIERRKLIDTIYHINYSMDQIDEIEVEDFIKTLVEYMFQKIHDYCRYKSDPVLNDKISISVIMTILNQKLTLFNLDKRLYGNYVSTLSKILIKDVMLYIKNNMVIGTDEMMRMFPYNYDYLGVDDTW